MSNVIAGALAVIMAMTYLLYYAYRLESTVLWLIIIVNLLALAYDYYKGITEGEDHI